MWQLTLNNRVLRNIFELNFSLQYSVEGNWYESGEGENIGVIFWKLFTYSYSWSHKAAVHDADEKQDSSVIIHNTFILFWLQNSHYLTMLGPPHNMGKSCFLIKGYKLAY